MNLSAVVLAGGQSRRMGRDKAWIKVDGQPLIARALSVVREAGIDDLFISGRPGVNYEAAQCPVLIDLWPGCGPLSGIERALRMAQFNLVLVLAVDMPRMHSDFLRKLRRQCRNQDQGVVPVCDGQFEPLAAIYPKHCHGIAAAFLGVGRRSARAFADVCLANNAIRAYPVESFDEPCFENWNTTRDASLGTTDARGFADSAVGARGAMIARS